MSRIARWFLLLCLTSLGHSQNIVHRHMVSLCQNPLGEFIPVLASVNSPIPENPKVFYQRIILVSLDASGVAHYVQCDAAGNLISSNACLLTGCTMTGPLYLASDPASALQASTKNYVDTKVAS